MTKSNVKFVTISKLHRTRFKDLGYRRIGPDWRFIATDAPDGLAAIGPFYASRAELLGDLTRYAEGYCGSELA